MRAARTVDAAAPWWRAYAPLLPLLHATDVRTALDEAASAGRLRSGGDRPLRFVTADAAGATPYEAHIHATGEVPTRDNLHDLFNALMWLALPHFKRTLNALQARALADAARCGTDGATDGAANGVSDGVTNCTSDGVTNCTSDGVTNCVTATATGRGATRDAATLLDENGLLLACGDAEVAAALARHDWHAAFVTRRAAWGTRVQALVCGHALLEKLQHPYKAVTAHALVLDCAAPTDAPGLCAALDAAAARRLGAAPPRPRDLQPLPVLGIPGWWADNEQADFYADRAVFRPARGASGARRAGSARASDSVATPIRTTAEVHA